MKKRIILHGATNCQSSNYGDYLYGELIYNYLVSQGYDAVFYQPSKYFIEYLPNYKNNTNIKKKDAVVYIPGGYFGEGHKARFRDNLIQFLRFMPLGIFTSFSKLPMAVVAIGAGPNRSRLLKYGVKRICNKSKFVSVRDNTSFEAINEICPNATLFEAGDLIISSKELLPIKVTKQIQSIVVDSCGKKILLVHFNSNTIALKLFANALKIFISVHPEYYVVVSSDSCLGNEDELVSRFQEIFTMNFGHFHYSDPAEFTAFLKKVDVVLTSKLHVGVVSACYNKSVISVAAHPEKTSRFYDQINESKRCVSLDETSVEDVVNLLESNHKFPISIPKKVINQAELSWHLLDDFLQENLK